MNTNQAQKSTEITSLVSKKLILRIFEAFSIQRWNDFIRPLELTEMDRAGEKMFLAFFIGKSEEKKGNFIRWNELIEGAIFEVLRRTLLSDIKSPVQRMIREKFPSEAEKINQWIFDQYIPLIPDKNFLENFSDYLFKQPEKNDLTRQVLRAAHKYATVREFEILRIVNEAERLGKIEEYLKDDMAEFNELEGLQDFLNKGKSYKLIIELERLRFQERWNQTPRVPKTSVLGHSFFVAMITLLISKSLSFPEYRQYNNFFAALFHDLPEAVTRDIISPVKRATGYFPEAIKQIEDLVMGENLFPLMDCFYIPEVMHYLADEFENKALVNGKTIVCDFNALQTQYCTPEFKPIDGKLVRVADHISAFIEADRSIAYGISSEHLIRGRESLLQKYRNAEPINSFDVADFFSKF